jgi:hypothetical protein
MIPVLSIRAAEEPAQSWESFVLREINILALVKGEEHYVFLYTEESQQETIQAIRDWAADPRLSFSWFDAAVLTQRLQSQGVTRDPSQPTRFRRAEGQQHFGPAEP